MNISTEERARRWRLALGSGAAGGQRNSALSSRDAQIDAALAALYNAGDGEAGSQGGRSPSRRGGLGASAPNVARWLGDIRSYFPSGVVRVMQQDALERLGLQQMLLEPEMLSSVEPDVHLVATLMSLKSVIPEQTKETARVVVRRVVDDLMAQLASPLQAAVRGALSRAERNSRPRHSEIDWGRTIRANLKHYQHDLQTVVPETLHGHGRRRHSLRDVVLCVDQSGSMASSVVYAGVFGAVLASLPALSTRMIVFDTSVVDLTEDLDDPVDLLFGVQLGGGTDINRALAYCEGAIRRPHDTILVLISDLYEGGDAKAMLKRAASLVASGVQVVALLALSDEGAPFYDHEMAARYAALGIPSFACTPQMFPDLMAAAIDRRDLSQWAAQNEITASRAAS
jgi:Mg-chelatase subunit ChlD